MVVTLTASILPGRAEAWRRLCQELLDSRVEWFARTTCRLGVRSLRIWMLPGTHGEIALIQLDVAHPDAILPALASSDMRFDRWLREQFQQLIGIDLAKLAEAERELVLEWDQEI